MKRWISMMLAWTMAVSCALGETADTAAPAAQPASQEIQLPGGGEAKVLTQGQTAFIQGDCAGGPVRSAEDAARVVREAAGLFGGNERTHFEPWNELRDPFGNTYYIFQQTYDDTIVLGGAAKVVTDGQGKMLGLTGSVVSDLPETEEREGLTQEQAEELVLRHEQETQAGEAAVIPGMTRRVVLPVDRELDLEAEEIQTRFVWAVYTANPSASVSGTDLPYLAHYVSMAGEYLYSLPTILPGDAAGSAGYDAEYVFQFMEPAEYTGYVDWSDGTEREITVTLMRDTRTGMYYLGNIEHRIVVADCWEFLYHGGKVVLEYSPDNLEWDQVGLLSLYNYCRVHDYYREIGWEGGDGVGTPMIVLKDFCDSDRKPVNNAAYAGKMYGWQCFLSSSINDFAQCLDVCAHEYTHCVTGTVMTYNAYHNDFGAINEALSDIQGNLCEMMVGATEDTAWLIGENSLETVRSMSDPNRFQQPAHSWDLYYQERVKTPTDINDRGGVHVNSSLLNRLAYLLCEEGGMTLSEARSFWFAVDCAMVPGTDFRQLRDLLPWVLRIAGLDAYGEALEKAISAVRLGEDELPETIDETRAMLVLELPDNEVFNNGNWTLNVLNVNVDLLSERISAISAQLERQDYEGLPALLRRMLDSAGPMDKQEPAEEKGFLELFLEELVSGLGENAEQPAGEAEQAAAEKPEVTVSDAEVEEAKAWLKTQMEDVLFNGMVSAGADGHTIRAMCSPGRALPILLYMKVVPNSDQLEKMKVAFFLNQHWVDLTGILSLSEQAPEEGEERAPGLMESGVLFDLLAIVFSGRGWEGILDGFSLKTAGGTVTEIPSTGLESITLAGNMAMDDQPTEENRNRKSRPKLPEGAEETAVPESTEAAGAPAEGSEEAAPADAPEVTAQPESAEAAGAPAEEQR